jgi:hypothetical protein
VAEGVGRAATGRQDPMQAGEACDSSCAVTFGSGIARIHAVALLDPWRVPLYQIVSWLSEIKERLVDPSICQGLTDWSPEIATTVGLWMC